MRVHVVVQTVVSDHAEGAGRRAAKRKSGCTPGRPKRGRAMSALDTVAKPSGVAKFMALRGPTAGSPASLASKSCHAAQSPRSGSGGGAARKRGRESRQPRAVDHLVAVGGDDDRPGMVGAAQNDEGAHRGGFPEG